MSTFCFSCYALSNNKNYVQAIRHKGELYFLIGKIGGLSEKYKTDLMPCWIKL